VDPNSFFSDSDPQKNFSDSDSYTNILTRIFFLNGASHCFHMCSRICRYDRGTVF
jgi:hypothetical protein